MLSCEFCEIFKNNFLQNTSTRLLQEWNITFRYVSIKETKYYKSTVIRYEITNIFGLSANLIKIFEEICLNQATDIFISIWLSKKKEYSIYRYWRKWPNHWDRQNWGSYLSASLIYLRLKLYLTKNQRHWF